MDFSSTVELELPYAEAVSRVREALAAQGFGVLTEIDVRATMQAKLGESMEDYVILGVCNPPLAHRALSVDRTIGLMLPCTVVVRGLGEQRTAVDFLDPAVLASVPGRAELEPIATEAAARINAARDALVG